ncbi:hypothetical protein [uncultured Algimonas sp.]|uniref:glycine-rich domain-containing protein n=1 Tax=uncultured Algimonas sp. TaxID=1547920 RepID=UPI0026382D38|nr:hypothetical protein [uncultured Algimonas sp.]
MRVFGPGTGQYAVPDGVVALDVVAQGGGGGGAGAHVPNVSVLAGAGGGGAGGHVKARITGSALQQSYTYTVGAGGAGGLSLPAAGETRSGEDGGDTQFGSGVAAVFASGGMGAPERIANGGYRHYLPGEGGSASGGDLAIAGQPGSSGTTYGSLNVITGSQAGGSTLLGGGGVPRPGNGLDATGYGAGGAGAGMTPKVVLAASGGAGSDGVLLLTEYY